mmetsp:Transcript_23028/g.36987  ORF Transcript_23028/g.36987 Transcript_23028/m.36987 type:complete len:322 (+) Transcript_23028:360-1325(+)
MMRSTAREDCPKLSCWDAQDRRYVHTKPVSVVYPPGLDEANERKIFDSHSVQLVDDDEKQILHGSSKVKESSEIGRAKRRSWGVDEHRRFLDGLELYGRDWRAIQKHVKTRTVVQIRSHAQKYFLKLERLGRSNVIPPRKMPTHAHPRSNGKVKNDGKPKKRQKWQPDEHERFVQAIKMYGRDWSRIRDAVGTRTVTQICSHAQKYFMKLERMGQVDLIPLPRPRKRKHDGSDGSHSQGRMSPVRSISPGVRGGDPKWEDPLPTPRDEKKLRVKLRSKTQLDFSEEKGRKSPSIAPPPPASAAEDGIEADTIQALLLLKQI